MRSCNQICLIVEETNRQFYQDKTLWRSYSANNNLKKKISDRPIFYPKGLKKVHFVFFGSKAQLCFYRRLHYNVHYSVSTLADILDIENTCAVNSIPFKLYESTSDHLYVDGDSPLILNNPNVSKLMEKLCVHSIYETLKGKKVNYKTRNTVGWSLTVAARNGKAWSTPEPALDSYCKNGHLKKPGYNSSFPDEFKNATSNALRFTCKQLKRIASDLKFSVPFLEKNDRHKEFSAKLKHLLNSKKEVFFEGCSVKLASGNVNIHLDKENCYVPGYDISSVLSILVKGERLTFIGYNRKRAFEYMKRKNNAQFHQSYNNKFV